MSIKGQNTDYGDYELEAFASAFYGSVHISVEREDVTPDAPERAARLDVSPTHARQYAAVLIEAANEAERLGE